MPAMGSRFRHRGTENTETNHIVSSAFSVPRWQKTCIAGMARSYPPVGEIGFALFRAPWRQWCMRLRGCS